MMMKKKKLQHLMSRVDQFKAKCFMFICIAIINLCNEFEMKIDEIEVKEDFFFRRRLGFFFVFMD